MSLELSAVSVAFRDGPEEVRPLRGLSMSIGPGELVILTGRSGAGKSTLLAVAGLLLAPDEGEVLITGTATSQLRGRARSRFRRDHLGFVFQSANLMPSLTALEQLQLVAHIRGGASGAAAARARGLLAEVGLGERARHRPHELSGGERQRVAVARALMAEPAVLLVDEPTAGLDQARGREIMELLARETRERNLCTVIATHDMHHIELADRVQRLQDGTLAASDPRQPV